MLLEFLQTLSQKFLQKGLQKQFLDIFQENRLWIPAESFSFRNGCEILLNQFLKESVEKILEYPLEENAVKISRKNVMERHLEQILKESLEQFVPKLLQVIM